MVLIDGYTIEQYPKQNIITIGLPQTMITATSSKGHISNSRSILSENELTQILAITKSYFEMEQLKEQKAEE